jgi:DNA polymerase-3 subunit alpha
MYGAVQFYKEAKARGIKPIIGIEAYVAQGSRFDQEKQPYHMTLLAKNDTGYRNLLTLATKAHLEGYYYKPGWTASCSNSTTKGSSRSPAVLPVRSLGTSRTAGSRTP